MFFLSLLFYKHMGHLMNLDYHGILKEFIIENFLFGDGENFQEETPFIESGLIDSTGILELITFIEEKFDLTIADDELTPDNFTNLKTLSTFLEIKHSGVPA